MNNLLPGIVITGASGFIGRHFVIAAYGRFRLFCLARRSQKEVGIPYHDNIHWLQADITNLKHLLKITKYIKDNGGADYVLHLAGYYDFTMNENPAYEKTNVTGTRYLLDMSRSLGVKRFIFSSSLAACTFPPYGKVVTEESPPDAPFPYAKSKAKGEEIIRQYSKMLPCSVVRLAAVYSDWCEYPVLFMLLKSWLSKNKLLSKVLAGKGESAIPYLHINDLVKLFLRIIEISANLPRYAIYNASPPDCVSHNQLYQTATKYYYGQDIEPFRMPRLLTALGLFIMSLFNRLNGKEPLEQLWMWKYVDKKLCVDASKTYDALGWKPTQRYHILRRLLFLTEKMITLPSHWAFKNETLLKRVAYRKSTIIYDLLSERRNTLVDKIADKVMRSESEKCFPNYRRLNRDILKLYITWNYQLIARAVRNRDRSMIPSYAQAIAYKRFVEGFEAGEVKELMFLTANTMAEYLLTRPELKAAKQRVDDYIILTSQFAADEFEDAFDILESQMSEQVAPVETIESLTTSDNLKQIIRRLEDVCSDVSSGPLNTEVTFKNYGALIKLTPPKEEK